MPIPFLIAGAAVATGIHGVSKGAKAMSNNAEAKQIMERAEEIYNEGKRKLDIQRAVTSKDLDALGKTKLDVWSGEMDRFVKLFKTFTNVRFEDEVELNDRLKMKIQSPNNLNNMEVATLKANEVLHAGISSLGAGALAGIASYGGAMMFASASTGTAIASLSGAAATNATLAWFGGGSIAAGGLGMSVGSAVLGGIVAGPVLAVAGSIMAAKSEENLANARSQMAQSENAVAQMETMTDFMASVSELSDDYRNFIVDFSGVIRPILQEIYEIRERAVEKEIATNGIKKSFFGRPKEVTVEFDSLSLKDQKALHLSWLMAQVLYSVLAAPLLTKKGDIDTEAKDVLMDAKDSIPELEKTHIEIQQLPESFTEKLSNTYQATADMEEGVCPNNADAWHIERDEKVQNGLFNSQEIQNRLRFTKEHLAELYQQSGIKDIYEDGKKNLEEADDWKEFRSGVEKGKKELGKAVKRLKYKGSDVSSDLSKFFSNMAEKLDDKDEQ